MGVKYLNKRQLRKGMLSMDIDDIESQHVGSRDDGASISIDGTSIGMNGSEDCASSRVDGSGGDDDEDASIRVSGSEDYASSGASIHVNYSSGDCDSFRLDCYSEDGSLIGMEDPHHSLLYRIRGKFETLGPPLTSECCIYRIPEKLRKVNEATYTPQIVSIGPFHRGNKELQPMEKHKERYLSHFLQRAKVSLEVLVISIEECEEQIRRCYAETIELRSDDFVEMILVDGGFIIEYFLRCCVPGLTDENHNVLYKPWLETDIICDLKLLENQLPFFVLEKLYNLAFSVDLNDQHDSFLWVVCQYFSDFNKQKISPQGQQVKHFTDLLRTFHLPSSQRSPPIENRNNRFSYSAMELHKAGVKFKVGPKNKCLFDIHFSNGELQIPYLEIDDSTETLVRNLMALEQCHYPYNTYICDYVLLMDTLINTGKDVELLVQNGIIFNWLGDNDVLATIFNNLCREIVQHRDDSYFCKLCEDLTEYYNRPWHSWKATLKRDYFSTPWLIASTIAAVILIMLTFMQTVNSFISLP